MAQKLVKPSSKTNPAKAKPGSGSNTNSNSERLSKRNKHQHNQKQEKDNEWDERVVQIRRVTKVVKGGKNLSFSALVVVGDKKGNLGVGLGKASEVVDAIRKAIDDAKKQLVRIPFDQGSIPHEVNGHYGSTKINMLRAPKGTGLITCWSIKMALEAAGLHNVVCKTHGSTNPINVLGALIDAIKNMKTKSQINLLRQGFGRKKESIEEENSSEPKEETKQD